MKSEILDHIALKGGTAINGIVVTPEFTLETDWGDLVLAKSEIQSILFHNPPTVTRDTIYTSQAGGQLEGNILPDKIKVKVEGGSQILTLPKKDLIAIVFLTNHASGKLSKGTRKALKALA
jgi:hypothetical protein